MSNPHQYIALITSLPHLGKLFGRKEVPISQYRLRQRMAMLEPEHARLLKELVEVTAWAGVATMKKDAEVIQRAREVIRHLADYPDLQHLVTGRMETRTLIAALRRRRNGQDVAGAIEAWGFGRWCSSIKANWADPAFGLGHFMPWVGEAHRLIRAEDHIGMERLVLTEVFRQLDHYSMAHEFDFEAVGIYVLRWIIVERWSRYNTDQARERLKALVAEALNPSGAAVVVQPVSARLFTETSPSLEGALP